MNYTRFIVTRDTQI